MTTALAQSLQLTDLQTYDRIWNLMNVPHKWYEIKDILQSDLKPTSIQKAFSRIAIKLDKPYKLRGQKLKKKGKK